MPLGYLPPLVRQSKRAQELTLDIQKVATGSDRRQLAAVGRYVHRGDSRWIPPLPYARQAALRPGSPLLTGETAGFLGIAQNYGLGEETVGTIAAYAQVSEDGEDAIGWWGLFDAINRAELTERLFAEAENWLFENVAGMGRLAGPAGMEPLTPAGMLVDGFDARPVALLPYNAPYYPELVEGEGYERASAWSAWTIDCAMHDMLRAETSTGGETRLNGPHGTPMTRGNWEVIRQAHEGTSNGSDRAPGMNEWLAHLSVGEMFRAHPHLRWALGRAFAGAVCARTEHGVCLGIPDFGPALRLVGGRLFPLGYPLYLLGLARVRRMRVFPAFAGRVSTATQLGDLYRALIVKAGKRGYREMVIAPIFEDDGESVEARSRLGARATQRFAVYEKEL